MTLLEKWNKHKAKIKLISVLAIEFIAVIVILLLVLFAGKKSYTVTFDLNGGVLLGGEVEQRVTQGQSATPPSVAKYGHYLLRWSGSYKSVTQDVTVKAIWEYETSPGIEYYVPENTNYCEISGSYRDIQGDVYIGAYYDNRQVMGIKEQAFKDRVGITSVHLLDGILGIADEAFAGCTSLEVIDIPSTVVRIGREAFRGCESLKEIILPASLKYIDESAFEGCTSLEKVTFYEVINEPDPTDKNDKNDKADKNDKVNKPETPEVRSKIETIGKRAFALCQSLVEINLPENLTSIGAEAFDGCQELKEIILPKKLEYIGEKALNTPNMTIYVYFVEGETPETFADGWHIQDAVIVYDYANLPPKEEPEEETDGKDKDKDDEDDKNFWEGLSI